MGLRRHIRVHLRIRAPDNEIEVRLRLDVSHAIFSRIYPQRLPNKTWPCKQAVERYTEYEFLHTTRRHTERRVKKLLPINTALRPYRIQSRSKLADVKYVTEANRLIRLPQRETHELRRVLICLNNAT